MTRHSVLLVPAASIAAVLALSACVPAASGAGSAFADFTDADDAAQIELLLAAEDAVAAEILVGEPAASGMFAVRADTSQLVFRDISSIVSTVGTVLSEDKGFTTKDGLEMWVEGRSVTWDLAPGKLSGTYEAEVGGSTSQSTFELTSCPDASGKYAGEASLTGTSGGVSWDIALSFDGKVGDNAYAKNVNISAAGSLNAGGFSQQATSMVFVKLGAKGLRGVSESEGAKAAGNWERSVEDFATKASLKLARQLEDYWRSGACIEVETDPAQGATLEPGARTMFDILPTAADGADIVTGTIAAKITAGGGKVTPSGAQPLETIFTFEAPTKPGSTIVTVSSTSKRGIGFGTLEFDVAAGWTFTETYADVTSTALKCGALTGEWTMTSTAPFGYQATTTWTFGDSLTATATTTGTADGYPFSGSHEMWIEESPHGDFELHASTGPNVFYLEPAPAGACD